MILTCATCGALTEIDEEAGRVVRGNIPIYAMGAMWCPNCADVLTDRSGERYADFPSRGQMIPDTIMTPKAKGDDA